MMIKDHKLLVELEYIHIEKMLLSVKYIIQCGHIFQIIRTEY